MTDKARAGGPFKRARLAIVRRLYAKKILRVTKTRDPALENAIAAIKREDYLGPGPWQKFKGPGYVATPNADPIHLYTDDLFGLIPDKGLNNGRPSFVCHLISHANLKPGEHAVHIGAGVGYYTAIMARLVGSAGRITAIEYEESLAARAAKNFAGRENVKVVRGDGATVAFDPADVILVNAGATKPLDIWLDRLADGGRLIVMLTTANNFKPNPDPAVPRAPGAVFRIVRRGDQFDAKRISGVGVYPCFGARDEVSEAALAAGFEKGGIEGVTRLYRTDDVPDERAWAKAPGWCLAYE